MCNAISYRPGFELRSLNLFPTTIEITPQVFPSYIYIYIYIYIYMYLVTVVEGTRSSLFSIPTIRKWKDGASPYPGLIHFTLDSTLLCWVLSKEVSRHHIFFLKSQPGNEPLSSMESTQPTRPIHTYIYILCMKNL